MEKLNIQATCYVLFSKCNKHCTAIVREYTGLNHVIKLGGSCKCIQKTVKSSSRNHRQVISTAKSVVCDQKQKCQRITDCDKFKTLTLRDGIESQRKETVYCVKYFLTTQSLQIQVQRVVRYKRMHVQ